MYGFKDRRCIFHGICEGLGVEVCTSGRAFTKAFFTAHVSWCSEALLYALTTWMDFVSAPMMLLSKLLNTCRGAFFLPAPSARMKAVKGTSEPADGDKHSLRVLDYLLVKSFICSFTPLIDRSTDKTRALQWSVMSGVIR